MSTEPSCPNPAAASPVIALIAIKRLPAVKMIRGGVVPSPGQNATPRAVVLPCGSLYSQTSFPVSASSARTRLAAGRYITPLTTIGVASGFAVGPPPAPRPPPRPARAPSAGVSAAAAGAAPRPAGALLRRYDQAILRSATFV